MGLYNYLPGNDNYKYITWDQNQIYSFQEKKPVTMIPSSSLDMAIITTAHWCQSVKRSNIPTHKTTLDKC
jgi:hypothetical protein